MAPETEPERAGMEGRSGNLDQEFPQGRCGKCGMGLLKTNTGKTCVNCVKPDFGGKITAKFKDKSERVLKDENEARELEGKKPLPPKQKRSTPQNIQPGLNIGIAAAGPDHVVVSQYLDGVYQILHKRPADSLPAFKKLLKYKKKIAELSMEIKTFLQE